MLPTAIGVCIATTLAANVAVLLADQAVQPPEKKTGTSTDQLVVAAHGSELSQGPVAPYRKHVDPQLMVVSRDGKPLPEAAIAKIRKLRGVSGAELVAGGTGRLAGKDVAMLGVNPSTFRNFTPVPSAKYDPLWRSIAAGDVAISFVLGTDGGIKNGSQVQINGASQSSQARVGAYATMGIGDIDAVVSKATAARLGMATDNVLLVGVPKKDLAKLQKKIIKVLPKKTASTVQLNPSFDFAGNGNGGTGLSGQEIRTAIQAGMTKLGVPYVWGGESDAEGGYDCSGLLQWAFAQAGIKLPRVAEDQARTGPWLPYSKAQVGDLLIWANDPNAPGVISHIAVYIGNNKMLVAPRTGDVVKIQQVYLRNFKGAVRINRNAAAQLAKTR
ncbi:MAG: C40 family peptidase [Streptosporangiaceae bacterium]